VNTYSHYTQIQRRLHWLVAAMVVLQFVLHDAVLHAMDQLDNGQPISFSGFVATTLHTWGGAAIGALMVYRLWLRNKRPVAVGAGEATGAARMAAIVLHNGFYVVLLAMVCTGVISYYFRLPISAQLHHYGKMLLMAMILLHVAAGLYHHYWKKDQVMSQMWRKKERHTDTIGD